MPTDLETARSSSSLDTWQIGSLLYDDGQREARARIAAILEKEPLCVKSKRYLERLLLSSEYSR
jgi:hypothetical protein